VAPIGVSATWISADCCENFSIRRWGEPVWPGCEVKPKVVVYRKSHQASLNGDIVSNAFCSSTVDTSNVSLTERMLFVLSVFHKVWTEVRKQEGLRKQLFVLLRKQELNSSWDGWPFGHTRHRPKIGGYAPFLGELGPHVTQSHLGRGLPPSQLAS